MELKDCNASIVLYKDDLCDGAWEDYCRRFKIPYDAEKIIIFFNDKNMDYEMGEDEDGF